MYEVREHIDLITPKGKGRLFIIKDYGTEMETIFLVIMNGTGHFWEFKSSECHGLPNMTMEGSHHCDKCKCTHFISLSCKCECHK